MEYHEKPITDTQPTTTVATVGSMIHMGVAMLWVKHGYDVEVSGDHGTLDAIHRERREIRDLKSVTRGRFDYWMGQNGPPDSVWKQGHVYGHDQGADETWTIIIDVLCRESGRTATFLTPYDPDVAAAAMEELAARTAAVKAGVPDIPDDRYGKGDPVCESCPFMSACWGEREEHPVFDDADIEKFALEYLAAQATESEAKKRKEAAKARLHGAQGPYGQVTVKWSPTKASTYTVNKQAGKKITVGRVSGE
jgi:hypothetical protein